MFINILCCFLIIIPASLLATVLYAMPSTSKCNSQRRGLRINFITFVVLVAFIGILSVGVFADSNTQDANQRDITQQANTQDAPLSQSSQNGGLSKGLGLIAAALVTGLAGIGGGIAVAAGAPSAIKATSENPDSFGKAIIFVALGESIALYGVVISILILQKI